MSATAQTKFSDTINRLDALLDQRLKREEAEQARADASLEEARRQRQRSQAEARTEIAARYDSAYASFGTTVPQAADDEPVQKYRARLFNRLTRRLPGSNEWSATRADDIPLGPAMDTIEALVLQAAQLEGQRPSFENLPDTGMVVRHRTDDMGQRVTEFFGRRSFIADMGRPGRPVERIVDRNSGQTIWGKPF